MQCSSAKSASSGHRRPETCNSASLIPASAPGSGRGGNGLFEFDIRALARVLVLLGSATLGSPFQLSLLRLRVKDHQRRVACPAVSSGLPDCACYGLSTDLRLSCCRAFLRPGCGLPLRRIFRHLGLLFEVNSARASFSSSLAGSSGFSSVPLSASGSSAGWSSSLLVQFLDQLPMPTACARDPLSLKSADMGPQLADCRQLILPTRGYRHEPQARRRDLQTMTPFQPSTVPGARGFHRALSS